MTRKIYKIPTSQSLANVALHYLGKYAASEASLRHVLENRIKRAAMRLPEFAADQDLQRALYAVIETIIEEHKRSGVLNDAAFAETKIISLRRQGRSRRMIEQKLAAKGVEKAAVRKAFQQYEEGTEPAEAELKAALAFAKRRKLGPFAKTPGDTDRRRKDFATLARAGFSSDIVRQILRTGISEEWE